MVDDTVPSFDFPAVGRKKVTAAFDGGRLTSDGGVMLLSLAERRLGIAERLARLVPDRRDPTRITHSIADMIRARRLLNDMRVSRLQCGRLPEPGSTCALTMRRPDSHHALWMLRKPTLSTNALASAAGSRTRLNTTQRRREVRS